MDFHWFSLILIFSQKNINNSKHLSPTRGPLFGAERAIEIHNCSKNMFAIDCNAQNDVFWRLNHSGEHFPRSSWNFRFFSRNVHVFRKIDFQIFFSEFWFLKFSKWQRSKIVPEYCPIRIQSLLSLSGLTKDPSGLRAVTLQSTFPVAIWLGRQVGRSGN